MGRKSPKSLSKSSSPKRNQTNITSSPSHPLLAKAPKIKQYESKVGKLKNATYSATNLGPNIGYESNTESDGHSNVILGSKAFIDQNGLHREYQTIQKSFQATQSS